ATTSRRSSRGTRTFATSVAACSGTAPRTSRSASGETVERVSENVDAEENVVVGGELVRRVAHTAVETPHEEHRRVDSRGRDDAGVVPCPRTQPDDRQAPPRNS